MSPRFFSTRDPARRSVSFKEALLAGLAVDGGLFVPDDVPRLGSGWQEATALPELALRALTPWLADDYGDEALQGVVAEALDFPIPLKALPGNPGLFVLELFHGPTLSFKDVAARVMARLMNQALRERRRTLTILVATSGDTGSAVADGFAGQEATKVVLLYPKRQVSPVQERQLIAARPGVRAFAVQGSFDDCQRMVKAAFADARLKGLALSSANSINVARLLPQMLYYFWAAQQLRAQGDARAPLFVVPSGNLGNLTGGVLAHLMGAPARGFIAAHNANDFFPRFLATGSGDFAPSKQTLSNAMDVGAPSNFERLRALLGDALPKLVAGESVSDEATRARMAHTLAETGYLADPHTAVGLEAASRRLEAGEAGPIVVLATAHPAKFPEVVAEALGAPPPRVERLERLWDAPTAVWDLPASSEALRDALLEHL